VKYDRKNLLSLKLRSSVKLRKLTRAELFTRRQIIRKLEPITNEAWKDVEEERWRKNSDNAPHGNPWHVSFHASQFPGDDPLACPRAALYQMMDFSTGEPFSRHSRAVMSAGKAIEVELVRTWHEAGILLSAAPHEEHQTGFQLEKAWLTGSVDAIIKPPRWNKPLPVEIKTKYQDVIDKMKAGVLGPDEAHVSQIKVQLAFVKLFQKELWPGLDEVTHGYIYYLSRDRPSDTAEFRVDLDWDFFQIGVRQLMRWRAWFEEGFLPSENPSKKHPMGWRWTYPPCKWCNFKKICKLDFEQGVTDLNESVGVERTKRIREKYDPAAARQRVLERWNEAA
jgi:CRISPR/Cas system-associated exonuclease Cas4 (RecB family)